ncbi:MAG: glycogen/starch synthase [Desulfocapsaceae bacterium]|nr:glycogen/starch synthase [Desulfocapsaceae bacterium]
MIKDQGSIKNIWMLTREYAGLAGAGGVKDVVKQLACTLARWNGRSVSVVMPRYGLIQAVDQGFEPLQDPLQPGVNLEFAVTMNYTDVERQETFGVWHKKINRMNVYLLEAQRFREKADVYTYTPAEEGPEPWKKQGMGHVDYFAMNVLLQKGALALMQLLHERPDIIHCHDGHTAILPAMIREIDGFRHYFRGTGLIVTIHNAGTGYHQDVADLPFAREITGLSRETILENRLGENFDPLIVAGRYAVLNTVSENYARELQETHDDHLTGWLGHRLAEMGIVLQGVTNGIDPADFDSRRPEKTGIAAGYDPLDDQDVGGKRNCKISILQKLSGNGILPEVRQFGHLNADPDKPLFTFIGRLNQQKGVDILISSIRYMLHHHEDFRVALLGSGGAWEEDQMIALAEQRGNRGRVCFLRGFSPATANQLYAAGDFFLIPSRYEPCGLTDYIAQLFGNIPIVHSVGGLVKVLDGKTGFTYKTNSREDMVKAIARAMACYASPECVRRMQRDSVTQIRENHTWDKVMKQYLQLYKKARQELM